MSTLAEKYDQASKLSRDLEQSIKIRKTFKLGNSGTVIMQKIKPPGASMSETHKHLVRIFIDGDLVKEMKLKTYLEKMED